MNNKSMDLNEKKEAIERISKESWLVGKDCVKDDVYMECVIDILDSEPFQKMHKYIQHGNTSTMEHCISVSYVSYKIARKMNFDYVSVARAGLLHDLFLYDWHTHAAKTGNYFHGYTHPAVALKNAEKYYTLNDVEKNSILRHMWPLTPIPPKYKEGYVIVYADKYCSSKEVLKESRIVKNIVGEF